MNIFFIFYFTTFRKQLQTCCSLLALLVGWALFIWLIWRASQVTFEWSEFDPYAALELDQVRTLFVKNLFIYLYNAFTFFGLYLKGADRYEVRKAYRRLSMIHHPDRGGDAQKFQLVAKAYETYVF